MDHRTPLKFHTVLPFEGMTCHIEEVVGQGSNAIVYRGWYPDRMTPEQKHHVLIKELFPFHPQQKIYRAESGQIITEPGAEEVWQTHRASFEAGNAVHLRLLEQQPELMVMGANLNSFPLNGTLYSVLGYTGGRSLQSELSRPEQELRRVVLRMIKLLDALEAFHQSGYLHLDISPDNIMLVGSGDREHLFLIDYNSARLTDDHSGGYLSCKPGYSAPEVTNGDEDSIDFSSDLYSVAAVFYRCLMGRKLTLTETLMPKAPDGSGSPLLVDAPQTVSNMVSRILRKGLNTLAPKRYQTIDQLRQAFHELLSRIDGTGVTHWALWESGRRSIDERIRINPALGYLKDSRGLYPIRLERGESILLSRYLDTLLSPRGNSALILAQGGMGKTTLLLHSAMLQGKKYSPTAPALFYIPLTGWNGADADYIRTRILHSLRFGREENTFQSAMQALHNLLQQPIRTKAGEIPSVLLLLDGLNELRGETGPLIQEINELSAMAGVRILAASRSEVPALELEPVRLVPLQAEDVEAALGSHGLLIPNSADVLHLLRTPLILSIYIKASEGQSQLDIHSEGELMSAYLTSLQKKEQEVLTEEMPEYWQIDAALNLVLPCIAAETSRLGHALTDRQLLPIVKVCWKCLHSRSMHRFFPQWIGHSRDILGNTESPEQWYGILVHNLLWQRMGLLIREPEGGYRVFHQVLEEHLAAKAKGLPPFRRTKLRIFGAVAAAALCIGLIAGSVAYCEGSNTRMENAIEYSAIGYQSSGSLYQQLRKLADFALAGNEQDFFAYYDRTMQAVALAARPSVTKAGYQTYIETEITDRGLSRVLWSALPFEDDLARELLGYSEAQAAYYARILPTLAAWMESEQLRTACPDLAECFSAALEAEATMVSELYQQVCAVHLPKGDARWAGNIQAMTAEISQQEAHRIGEKTDRSPSLSDLRTALRSAKAELENRNRRIEGYLRDSVRTAQQQLADVRQLLKDAGIDSLALNDTEQILNNMTAYWGHKDSQGSQEDTP